MPATNDAFGFNPAAPMIGSTANRLTSEEARALLRFTTLPTSTPNQRLMLIPDADSRSHVANIVDCLGAEDARLIIKQILGLQRVDQPERPVGTNCFAPDGDLAVANPGEFEGRGAAGSGIGRAQAGGQPLGGDGRIDTPQSNGLLDDNDSAITIRGRGHAQEKVSPIGAGDVIPVATLQVAISLRINSDIVLHGDE